MPPTHPLVLAIALAATGGCLYLDDVNHAPVARLAVPPQALVKCDVVILDGSHSFDPDPGDTSSLVFHWTVDGLPLDQLPGARVLVQAQPDPRRLTLKLLAESSYVVELTVEDPQHARSVPARGAVRVANALPEALPIVVQGSSPPSACGDLPPEVDVDLAGRAADDDGACDASFVYRWTLSRQPDGAHPSLTGGSCRDGAAAPGSLVYTDTTTGFSREPRVESHACLRPDVPGRYTVELFADDGAGMQRPTQHTFSDVLVGPDRPPCMDGVSPAPGVYVLDRDAPATFRVTEVLDDLDAFPSAHGRPRFTWSTWRERDPVWREAPSYALPSYTIDPSEFELDERVRVRVAVADRVNRAPAPTCPTPDALCPLLHDFPPAGICQSDNTRCEQWVTWDVRFR